MKRPLVALAATLLLVAEGHFVATTRRADGGDEVLSEIRRRDETREVGVIVLTARRDEADRIKGLAGGADDYLTKPFSPRELVARVKAVLRRGSSSPGEGLISVGRMVPLKGR